MNKEKVTKSIYIWVAAVSVLCITFLVMASYEFTKKPVQVSQNGQKEIIRTHANTVKELMSEMGITVHQHDELSHKLSDPIERGMDVNYIASKRIQLAIDRSNTEQYNTTASTVGEFFDEQGLEFQERDEVSHDLAAPIEQGMDIEVQKAFQVTLHDGGEKEKIWTTATTVGDLLKDQQVELSDLDQLNVSEEEIVKADTPIKITRIEKMTDTVEEDMEYAVETRRDESLPKGERKVLSSGENGLVTKKYEVILENGEEKSRELIEETVQKESRKEIIALGTKVEEEKAPVTVASASSDKKEARVVQASAKPSDKQDDTKTLQMHATAYTANCAGCSGVTATGIDLKENPDRKVVAVDPDVIPLGSRVWVEGYGTAIAGDTGGAIDGKRIDLFVPSKSQAHSYGRKQVTVKILD
ncbi:ubiquitin-like domain-containing protein [Halobacillus sp. ACCC02827]|uniref:G5 and 3D domain-containing protein n=1 Tax=unclassified Halobacillus TaxID=2636472 RepID=UPI000781A20A|nr:MULTISPECIES: G5 and 3D domain-containing protein [unclassified Halobacillus]WJE15875.1 ubiquitin-like domain-containing protein [Halobacillus sp. ACCC02827]